MMPPQVAMISMPVTVRRGPNRSKKKPHGICIAAKPKKELVVRVSPKVERGYAVTACDISAEMVALARAKAPESELFVADIRSLEETGNIALVLKGGAIVYSNEEKVRQLGVSQATLESSAEHSGQWTLASVTGAPTRTLGTSDPWGGGSRWGPPVARPMARTPATASASASPWPGPC